MALMGLAALLGGYKAGVDERRQQKLQADQLTRQHAMDDFTLSRLQTADAQNATLYQEGQTQYQQGQEEYQRSLTPVIWGKLLPDESGQLVMHTMTAPMSARELVQSGYQILGEVPPPVPTVTSAGTTAPPALTGITAPLPPASPDGRLLPPAPMATNAPGAFPPRNPMPSQQATPGMGLAIPDPRLTSGPPPVGTAAGSARSLGDFPNVLPGPVAPPVAPPTVLAPPPTQAAPPPVAPLASPEPEGEPEPTYPVRMPYETDAALAKRVNDYYLQHARWNQDQHRDNTPAKPLKAPSKLELEGMFKDLPAEWVSSTIQNFTPAGKAQLRKYLDAAMQQHGNRDANNPFAAQARLQWGNEALAEFDKQAKEQDTRTKAQATLKMQQDRTKAYLAKNTADIQAIGVRNQQGWTRIQQGATRLAKATGGKGTKVTTDGYSIADLEKVAGQQIRTVNSAIQQIKALQAPYKPKSATAELLNPTPAMPDTVKQQIAALQGEITKAGTMRERINGILTTALNKAPKPQPTKQPGLLEPGNIDLHHRPVVKNADGTISTVRSISVGIDGKEVLIPTVSPDGHLLTTPQAIAQFRHTGQHLGKFDTPAHATAYAQQLHQQQAKEYGGQRTPRGRGGQIFAKNERDFFGKLVARGWKVKQLQEKYGTDRVTKAGFVN